MTNIHIHGALGKLYGFFLKAKINSAKEVLNAIDANRKGFKNTLFKLSEKKVHYIILLDGVYVNNKFDFIQKRNIKEVHILPAIIGSGQAVAVGLGLATTAASGAVTLTTSGVIVATLVNVAISAGISMGVSYIMSALNKQAAPPQQNISVGGSVAATVARGRSYIFGNIINTTSQGAAIPVGYGRMKVGSSLVLSTIKNYNTSQNHYDVFSQDVDLKSYNEYLSN